MTCFVDLPRCSGITSSGTRCERVVSREGELCYSHDPRYKEDRKATASKAGKLSRRSNPIEEVVGLRARLDEILNDVLEGDLSTARGQVAATIIGVALKSFEIEKKQREFIEIEKRLAEVEKVYKQGRSHPEDIDSSFNAGGWLR